MRPIKFRGRDVKTGEYRYGDLVQTEAHRVIMDGTNPYLVDPDTVAQFVGYDANGKEVYEGDTVIGEDNTEWTVDLHYASGISEEGFLHYIDLEFCKLKEADQ